MKVWVVLIVAGLVCYLLSNFISNSATAALLIPILIVVANGMADPEAANNAQFLAMGGTSDRHGGDQGYDPRRPDHRHRRFRLRLFLADQAFPVRLINPTLI